jgi:hypothetical protein
MFPEIRDPHEVPKALTLEQATYTLVNPHVRYWARQAADARATARNRQNQAVFDGLLTTALICQNGLFFSF